MALIPYSFAASALNPSYIGPLTYLYHLKQFLTQVGVLLMFGKALKLCQSGIRIEIICHFNFVESPQGNIRIRMAGNEQPMVAFIKNLL
ncbi:hypothetical protein SAMN05660909_02139 [Chitinophaga terrae (ex Kim and Jung 2007)]|uniref:Uncharacterized protein n=1 Tax=Chitinophaga terrae (ex Kim and Jung 2007) TaxID=408074 RepID=A0A1H4BL26_9BACT|nr:hypothetical protein [Chitinophaga terrae (ex Kim and Jung 2007)]SEA48841.1 hypothetical protein SAMN05660909_02139 [Chitinophaga terrae (ex Kim and Jung 2007)]